MCAVALGSCGVDQGGGAQFRTDIEPVSSRVPPLTMLRTVSWSSGDVGDPRVPGPGAYWIRGIGTISSLDASRLRNQPDAAVVALPSGIHSASELGQECSSWIHSDALDEEWTRLPVEVEAYVCFDRGELAFSIVGE